MTDHTNAMFSAADLADTGQWRLLVYISDAGLTACLRHVNPQAAPAAKLTDMRWTDDGRSLLEKIENAVYDNPRLLDDYATEIIIQTPKALFVPTGALDEPGSETDFMERVYPASGDDIFTDGLQLRDHTPTGESCIYTLTPGLQSFLQRTLPGSKVSCHLSVLIDKYRQQTSELTRIYVDIRRGEADIIALNGTQLLSASVHEWQESPDIAYRVLLLMKSYGLTTDGVEVRLGGLPETKTELAALLRKMIGYVVYNHEPASAAEMDIPLALALAIEK